MARTLVAMAVLLLVIGFVMWQRRRPLRVPKVTILSPPEPPEEPIDTETYELVDAGIPEELINQYVAAKEGSWWDRSIYKAAGAVFVGAGAAAYLHWRNEAEKQRLREMLAESRRRERTRQQQRKNLQYFRLD